MIDEHEIAIIIAIIIISSNVISLSSFNYIQNERSLP